MSSSDGAVTNTQTASLSFEEFPDRLQYLPTDEARKLIEAYATNKDVINRKGTLGGYTALHWCCIKNDYKSVQYLVSECKADVNSKANLGETALLICTKNGNFILIEYLINNGADLYVRDIYNRSIIHWSAYTGKTILINYFEKYHNLNLNDSDQFKQNALHIACGCSHMNLIKYIMKTKAIGFYEQDFNGNTCFHLAAKAGLPSVCWKLVERAGKRLITIKNNENKTALDMISGENTKAHRSIREWLKYETKEHSNETYTKIFLYLNWLMCLLLPAYAYTLPLFINRLLFGSDILTVYKGFISYGALVLLFIASRQQSHRLKHVSGMRNPFYTGFFLILFIYNYISFYMFFFGLIKSSMVQLMAVIVTIVHMYSYCKVLFYSDPGYATDNCRNPDNTEFTLKDLIHEKWSNLDSSDSTKLERPHIFCESCVIVVDSITKHCKLCDKCCLRFDHHCLFLNKCVGLKNHQIFVVMILSSVLCMWLYLAHGFVYLKQLNDSLSASDSLLFHLVSCSTKNWLITLLFSNFICSFMLTFLLFFQLNVTSYGFTSQFRPYNMSALRIKFTDRLRNLYTFFFSSYTHLEELYFKQNSLFNELYKNRHNMKPQCCNNH